MRVRLPLPTFRCATPAYEPEIVASSQQECYRCVCSSPGTPGKPAANARKHGVTFAEAETVFDDPLAGITEDELHPERLILLGESKRRRLLLVVHVEIDQETVRLISARLATRHERRRYEEGTQDQ